MTLIAILDFFTLILSLSSLIIILIGWKEKLSIISRLSFIALLGIISFYYMSNFLEWSGISDTFVSIEDYIALLAPLFWFFFLYTYLQKKNEKVMLENQENLEGAYRYTEFYKDLFTHDIRNILQNILLANDLFEQSDRDHKQVHNVHEILTLIKEQVLRGENLITDVSKLSEIRNSTLKLQIVDLIEILDATTNRIKNLLDHRRINVQFVKDNEKVLVNVNNLLQNVIENLLFNSIMHNKSDTIEVLIKLSKYKAN